MEDVGPEEELTLTQIEEMTKKLASELKNSIHNVDRKFEQLNHTIHHHHDQSIVSEFLTLKNVQMLHQREFDEMEALKYTVLEKLGRNKSMFMLVNREMQRLKKEEQNLNQKMIHTLGYEDLQVAHSQESMSTVRGKYEDVLEGFKKGEENAISRNKEWESKCSIDYLKEDNAINPIKDLQEASHLPLGVEIINPDTILSSFSRKLKLIKHFYLANSLRNQVDSKASTSNDSGMQELKFNWIREGKGGKFEEEVASGSKEFRVKNKDELEFKIQGLLEERREEMEKARAEGKMSYLQWADNAMLSKITENTRTRLVAIQDKVTEILNEICVQMCELMFVSARNFRQFRQWTNFKHIFILLMVLQEPEETVYLGKIVSFLEASQHTLQRTKQYNYGKELEGMSSEIDLLLDLFLREVLCLESVLTYPIFCPSFDENTMLVNVGKSLGECMKQVKEFGYSTAKDGDSLVPPMTILVNREIDRLMKARRNLNRKLSSILRSISTEDGRSLQVIHSQESTSESLGVKEDDHDFDGVIKEEEDLKALNGSSSSTDSHVVQSQKSTSERAHVKEDDHDFKEGIVKEEDLNVLDGSSSNSASQVVQSQASTSERAHVKEDDHDFKEGIMKEEEDLNVLDGSSSNTASQVVQSQESTSEIARVKEDNHDFREGIMKVEEDLNVLDGSSSNTASQVVQSQESTSERASVKEDDHDFREGIMKVEEDLNVLGGSSSNTASHVVQSQESTSERARVKEDDHDFREGIMKVEGDLNVLDGSSSNAASQVVQSQESTSERAHVKEDDHDFKEGIMKLEEDLNVLDGSSSNTASQVVQSQESTTERDDVKNDDHCHDEGFKKYGLSAFSGSSSNTDSQVGYSQESSLKAERTDGKDDDLRAVDSCSSSKDSQAVIEEDISPEGGGNLGEESVHLSLTTTTKHFKSSLSRKLKLIKYYYLANGTMFNWLRDEKDVKFEEEGVADSEEFRVRNEIEMEKRIAVLIEKRQNDISRAQTEGNMSFMKWYDRAKILRKRISQVTTKKTLWIYHVGIRLYDALMAHVGGLMFTSETFGQLRKWIELKNILLLLMLLQQDDETILFKKTIEFMEVTQARVLINIQQQQPRHAGESENYEVMNSKLDEFIESILRELLCLESIVSYPMLYPIHANSKLDAIGKCYEEERKKQMNEIMRKVNEFKSTAKDLAMWIRSNNFFDKPY